MIDLRWHEFQGRRSFGATTSRDLGLCEADRPRATLGAWHRSGNTSLLPSTTPEASRSLPTSALVA
jgi:hypothetical protein